MQASLGASPRPTTNCARSIRDRALNGRSSSEQGPEDRKDNTMIAVALAIAWFAVPAKARRVAEKPVQFLHQGVVPNSRRLPSEGRICRCKSCHPDQIFRCGVTAAQRPLKPSGAGAEPAAGANFRAASQDRAPTARAVRRKFATSKQPIGRARVKCTFTTESRLH